MPVGKRRRESATKRAELKRFAVCEEIFGAGSAKLILLRAPAGFGKTTVMLQVRDRLEETGLPTAWLTLDRTANDTGHFLDSLMEILSPLIPSLRTIGPAKGHEQGGIAVMLIDAIEVHPAPFVLFLDDFEVLRAPVVLGIVQEFLEQLPRGAQVIMSSRGEPEIGLGRLRVQGRLLEIGAAQLRFSQEEVEHFFCSQSGLNLKPSDIRRLHRSTEGWGAALGLAALALRRREAPETFIAGFSGSNATVMDYLMEDVLSRLEPHMRRFLLRTSILTQLNASICDEVCGQHDSASMLRKVEQCHLFLVPLGAEQAEFRYHRMFAEFLRAQLIERLPDEVPDLHEAAAKWYLKAGRPVLAIEHALAADDTELALSLLDAHGLALLEQGRVRLLSRWLEPLLESGALDSCRMLQVVHGWAVCLARGPKAAAPFVERLEAQVHTDPQLNAHLLALKSLLMVLTDRIDEAMVFTTKLLGTLPSDVPFVRGFLESVLGNLLMIIGRYDDALRVADSARSRQPEHGSSLNFALSEAVEGAVDLTQGRLRRAIARLQLAVSAGTTKMSHATNGNALPGVLLAEALYEADQCQQAERLLGVYIPLIREVRIPDQLITAHVVMARIAVDRGDLDRAHQLLTELEHIGYRDGLPRVVASARLERVRMFSVGGRPERARFELDRCRDRTMWQRVSHLSLRANEVETWDVALARWSIASHHAHEVIDMLRSELDVSERAQRQRRAMTIRLLLAQALGHDGQTAQSMDVLVPAVRLAASEGYVRLFKDEGPQALDLLHELRVVSSRDGVDAEMLAFLNRLLKWHDAGGSRASPSPPDAARLVPSVAKLLTRKEVQVLQLVAEGLFNKEIAERMFIAETTVRTHLRNINVKLDTRNRIEAVAMAQEAGLLP